MLKVLTLLFLVIGGFDAEAKPQSQKALSPGRELICHDKQTKPLVTISGPSPTGARKARFLGTYSSYGLMDLEICGDQRAQHADYGSPGGILYCFDQRFNPRFKFEIVLAAGYGKNRIGDIEISNPRRLENIALGVCEESR